MPLPLPPQVKPLPLPSLLRSLMPFKPLSLMTSLDLYLVNLIECPKDLKLENWLAIPALSLLRLGLLLPPL